jgi:hypothetical protein
MTIFRARLQLPLPEGWFAKESLTLLEPNGQGNVIASSEPLDDTIDARQYADVQGELLRNEFPGYVEHEFEPARVFGGRPGWRRHFSWTPPDSERVTQIQAYYAAAGRGYTATATTPSSSFESLEADFHRVLDGMALEPAARE